MDTNVLSALWSSEPLASVIATRLAQAHSLGGLVVSAPVYAELMAHPSASRSFVDGFLSDTGVVVDFVIDEPVWQKAASSFAAYAHRRRRSGSNRAKRLLVDFVIGAHAMLRADQLMTLDPERYKRDFSGLRIV